MMQDPGNNKSIILLQVLECSDSTYFPPEYYYPTVRNYTTIMTAAEQVAILQQA